MLEPANIKKDKTKKNWGEIQFGNNVEGREGKV
jgi:hypothetical protein